MKFKQNQQDKKAATTLPAALCPKGQCQACAAVATAGIEATRAFFPIMRRQDVAAGDRVWRDGNDGGGLAVVASGVVMVQRILSDGRRQVVAFRFPGDVIGVAAEADPRWQPVAVTPVVLCRADGRTLEGFRRAHPAAGEKLTRLRGAEAARLADHLLVLGRLTATERLAAFLLDCLIRAGRRTEKGVVVELPMTRDDIADYLGINVETVSRRFSQLKKSGVIALPKPGRVVVPDAARLQALVPFTPATPGAGSAALSETPAAA